MKSTIIIFILSTFLILTIAEYIIQNKELEECKLISKPVFYSGGDVTDEHILAIMPMKLTDGCYQITFQKVYGKGCD